MAKAKTTTTRVGRTTVKGATAADRQQIAAAREANDADRTTASRTSDTAARENTKTGAATPEAQDTPKAAREAAQKLFDKADDEGKATMIAEAAARNAALGY